MDAKLFKKRVQNLLKRLTLAEGASQKTCVCADGQVQKREAAVAALIESDGHAGNAYLELEKYLS